MILSQGRMTRALDKLKLQSAQTNAGSTSTIRVEVRGVGLTGALLENYLVQARKLLFYFSKHLSALIGNEA